MKTGKKSLWVAKLSWKKILQYFLFCFIPNRPNFTDPSVLPSVLFTLMAKKVYPIMLYHSVSKVIMILWIFLPWWADASNPAKISLHYESNLSLPFTGMKFICIPLLKKITKCWNVYFDELLPIHSRIPVSLCGVQMEETACS